MNFEALEMWVIGKLEDELSPQLSYHSVSHTKDVLRATRRLAKAESIPEKECVILDTGALLHDAGFLISFDEHEMHGCEIARSALPEFGYGEAEIETVCRLIMATKVPQQPKDILEFIICDADLDYLGREDFFEIGDRLYEEFLARGIVTDFCAWDRLQVSFLEKHQYFTDANKRDREKSKLMHLEKIKERLSTCL